MRSIAGKVGEIPCLPPLTALRGLVLYSCLINVGMFMSFLLGRLHKVTRVQTDSKASYYWRYVS